MTRKTASAVTPDPQTEPSRVAGEIENDGNVNAKQSGTAGDE